VIYGRDRDIETSRNWSVNGPQFNGKLNRDPSSTWIVGAAVIGVVGGCFKWDWPGNGVEMPEWFRIKDRKYGSDDVEPYGVR
jgi:hypothetical protein